LRQFSKNEFLEPPFRLEGLEKLLINKNVLNQIILTDEPVVGTDKFNADFNVINIDDNIFKCTNLKSNALVLVYNASKIGDLNIDRNRMENNVIKMKIYTAIVKNSKIDNMKLEGNTLKNIESTNIDDKSKVYHKLYK
jgi:hypothetical protein